MHLTAGGLRGFLKDFRTELTRAAAEAMDQDMPLLTQSLFDQFERTGSRLEYEAVYFTRRKLLALIGLQALLEKRELGFVPPERLQKLSHIIQGICAEECWALPAHVDRTAPQWRITVDLFAAETAQTLAELADGLSDELSEPLRKLAAHHIRQRVLEPFFQSPTPYGAWEGAGNNWNAVCAGAIGSACLHLLREQPELLAPCLERVCASLLGYISGFAADGTCPEGCTYYTYGMTYFVNFASELYEYTGGTADLLCGQWGDFPAGRSGLRARIARFFPCCFFPDGESVCFSDAIRQETFRMGLSCSLAARGFGTQIPNLNRAAGVHTDPNYRFAALKLDLLATQAFLDSGACPESLPEPPASRLDIFPDAQWCAGRSASGAGFACKGGHNGAPHNHNDIGHFIYEAENTVFFADLGLGEYCRDYFGPARYEILCNSSFGHSVPVVNGFGQCAGPEFRCESFSAGPDGTVALELHAAYPPGLLERFSRTFRFDLETGGLLVRDMFLFPRNRD